MRSSWVPTGSALGNPHLQEQEAQDGVRLGLGNADDAARESWLDVDTLPASDWMDADNRVNRLNGFAMDVESGSAGAISLGDSTVESGKTFQVDLHPRAEGRVQGVPGRIRSRSVSIVHLIVDDLPRTPEGITPTFRGRGGVGSRMSHHCARVLI